MQKTKQSRLTLVIKLLFLGVISSPGGLAAEDACQLCSCTETWAGESVKCTSRNLSTVPQGFPATSFALYLDRNNLTRISRGDFWNLTKLTHLYLSHNKISYLESGSFENLTSLAKLHMEYNQIRHLGSKNFHGLTKLTYLYLEYNNITFIPDGIFQDLVGLYSLQLDENMLMNISSGTFRGLKVLRYLYLRNNNIQSIAPGGFQDLESLRDLYLEHNNISELLNGTFRGLKTLQRLFLTENRIQDIAPGTFADVKTLRGLKAEKSYEEDVTYNTTSHESPGNLRDQREPFLLTWLHFLCEDVREWMRKEGLKEYVDFFCDRAIDGESLKCMNEDTLKTLVPLAGPRLKIMEKINKLNAQESTGNCSFQSMPSGMPTIVVQEDEPLAADKAFLVLQTKKIIENGSDAKEVAKGRREGMPPFMIFEGELHSPDDIFISGEQDLFLKI
ncbi:hypothetical protein ACROYT_G012597 [Oculina patagonica]